MEFGNIILVLIFVIFFKYLRTSDPPKVNGVYSQPNKWYWIKFWVFRFLLWLRKRQQHKKVTGKNVGMGRKSRNSPEEMDMVQVLPKEHPLVSCCYRYLNYGLQSMSVLISTPGDWVLSTIVDRSLKRPCLDISQTCVTCLSTVKIFLNSCMLNKREIIRLITV